MGSLRCGGREDMRFPALLLLLLLVALAALASSAAADSQLDTEDNTDVDISIRSNSHNLIRDTRDAGEKEEKRDRNQVKRKQQGRKQRRAKKRKDDNRKNEKPKTNKNKEVRTRTRSKKKKKKTLKSKKSKKKNTKKEKEIKKKKSIKLKRKQKLRLNKERTNNRQQRQPAIFTTTCSATQVDTECLQIVVDAMEFEKTQIQNFFKQKSRLQNHNKIATNKLGKKGEFEDAAKYLLLALGGNLSAPACGDSNGTTTSNSSSRAMTREVSKALLTFNTLNNCSATIKEACTMPEEAFNETKSAFLLKCEGIFNKSKSFSDDCRTNKAYTTNGTAACECWNGAAGGIKAAKAEGCKATESQKIAKAVKKNKEACKKAFLNCRQEEDNAVALIHACAAGDVTVQNPTGRML